MARAEAARGSGRGPSTSDYADMSNEKPGGNPGRRNPKASRGRFVRPGSVGTSGQAEGRSRWTAGQHSCTRTEGQRRSVGEGQWRGSMAIPCTRRKARAEWGFAPASPCVHAA